MVGAEHSLTIRSMYQLAQIVQKMGKPVEYVVYEDEGHEFFKRKNRVDQIRRTVEFFVRYLGK